MDIRPTSERVETARGLACVLLVAYHVVGNHVTNGLNVTGDSPWRIATLIFEHLRMPLFSFLSGYVYAYRPVVAGRRLTFISGKLQRLLVPLLVVSTLFFLFQALVSGVNAPARLAGMGRIYLHPYAHFWFLQAILLIFLLTVAVEPLLRSLRGYLVFMLLLLLAHFWLPVPTDVFSLRGALYLAPFFFLGLGANRFPDLLCGQLARSVALPAMLLLWAIYVWICIADTVNAPAKSTLFGTALSVVCCLTLIQRLPALPALAWIGHFSFAIYLYHVFFTAGARIALQTLGEIPLWIHAPLGLAAGLAGPILIELALRPLPVMQLLFLGKRLDARAGDRR